MRLTSRAATRSVLACLLALGPLGAGAAAQDEADASEKATIVVTIGIEPDDAAGNDPGRYTPVLRAIERGLKHRLDAPLDVRLAMLTGTASAVSAVQRGTVDVARLETATYVRTIDRGVTTTILAAEHHRGHRAREGLFVVRQGSDMLDIDELRGRPVLLGMPGGTLGLAARAELAGIGLRASDLEVLVHPTQPKAVIEGLLGRRADAAVIPSEVLRRHPERENLRVLRRFNAESRPWVARSGLDPTLRRMIAEALFDMTSPAALKALGCSGFLSTEEDNYDGTKKTVALADRFNRPVARVKP